MSDTEHIEDEVIEEEEGEEVEIEVEELEDDDDGYIKVKKEDFEGLQKAKSQLTARAKTAEEKNRTLLNGGNKKPITSKPKVDDDIRQKVDNLTQIEEKRQFGYANNLSPKEVDYIFKINPNPTAELLQDDFIQGGLERIRSKDRVANNTPSISGRPTRFEAPKSKNGEATSSEKQKNFDDWRAKRFQK